jgi:hypothetical protein
MFVAAVETKRGELSVGYANVQDRLQVRLAGLVLGKLIENVLP